MFDLNDLSMINPVKEILGEISINLLTFTKRTKIPSEKDF